MRGDHGGSCDLGGVLSQPEGTHLAQFNWATLRHDADDPRVAEFIDNVARMNALADRMPGFIWRHQNDRQALAKLKRPLPFATGKRFTTTLSVWADIKALETFAFKTVHRRFYDKRAAWFEEHARPYMTMWYVPRGQVPTVAEAGDRASDLLENGDSARAFGCDYARAAA